MYYNKKRCGKNIKIIIMVVFLIIIIVELAIGLHLLNNEQEATENILQEQNEENMEVEQPIEKVRERNEFYTASACVDKYLSYVYAEDIDILYNYLDNEYIEENGITKNNVLEKIEKIDNYKIFVAKEMYKQKVTENITKYYAYGAIKDELEDGEAVEEEFFITIKIDSKNGAFSVLPNTYID